MIEFDVDMGYLLEEGELDCVVLNDENGEHEPMTFYPIGVECTPHGEWESISQSQEVRHVFCDCGYELGKDERDSWPFQRTRLFAMPNFCPECGHKIRKAVKRG